MSGRGVGWGPPGTALPCPRGSWCGADGGGEVVTVTVLCPAVPPGRHAAGGGAAAPGCQRPHGLRRLPVLLLPQGEQGPGGAGGPLIDRRSLITNPLPPAGAAGAGAGRHRLRARVGAVRGRAGPHGAGAAHPRAAAAPAGTLRLLSPPSRPRTARTGRTRRDPPPSTPAPSPPSPQ